MALLLFISGNIAVILLLLYGYFKVRHRNRELTNKLNLAETALSNAKVTDQKLTKEVASLQGKMDRLLKDPLTQLLGWQLFEDRLIQNIKESERYHLTLGILFVDIDDFKMINDGLSYEVGDAVLIEVGERIKTCIRQVDSVSRFSKDTFAVLLTQLSKPETAAVVAQRMLQAISAPLMVKGHELYLTAGIGIAIYPSDAQDAASLLRSADHALHLAKEKNKNNYQFYQERLHAESQRELTLYTNLSRETAWTEFVLYYEPIQNIETSEIFCMDALLFWQEPQFGLISKEEVYTLAQRQHKLNILTEWTLKAACQQFLHWRSLGFNPAFLGVSLSIKQLENTSFIYHLSQIFQDLGFNPHSLLLEIKESITEVAPEVLEKAFNMLKYLGVKIAIDHFGTGAFSLVHLKDFSINFLKLDPRLIDDLESNQETLALIRALFAMGNTLKIDIILQGVKSEEEVELLKNLGGILMQGPLIYPLLSEKEVETKMLSLME